jgi:hypothetical protein
MNRFSKLRTPSKSLSSSLSYIVTGSGKQFVCFKVTPN